jgi:hypothetical protein
MALDPGHVAVDLPALGHGGPHRLQVVANLEHLLDDVLGRVDLTRPDLPLELGDTAGLADDEVLEPVGQAAHNRMAQLEAVGRVKPTAVEPLAHQLRLPEPDFGIDRRMERAVHGDQEP